MDAHPILVQSAFTIPITAGVALYTLLGRERTRLHYLVAGLLASVCLWLASLVLGLTATSPGLREAALDLQILTICTMPPFFLVTMGHLARSQLFERSQAAILSLVVVFALFYLAYLANGQHGLFITDADAALAQEPPKLWAGPLFWVQQVFAHTCNVLAVTLVLTTVFRGRTFEERRRALVVATAISLPVIGHLLYMFEWIPLTYTPAPAALGVTAVMFVRAVHRYGLLDAQPIVRHDVLEHVHDGLLLADPSGVVLDTNAAAEALLGQDREGLRGDTLGTVLGRLGFEGALELGARITALSEDGGRLVGEVETADGRIMEIAAGAVAARGPMPAGRFVTLRDRSEERRSERLLRERQRLESVGILAAGVAHEVNNPLAFVRANLAHLQTLTGRLEKHLADEPEAADLREMPDIVAESLDGLERIRVIVDGMLRLSRAPDEAMRPVDLNEVVGQALRLAELQRSAGVRVERDLAEDLPPVQGSADRLVQVLLNLFLNAKQSLATRGGGCIVARTANEAGTVVVRVEDDGPGIPDDHRERIFDPFFTTRQPGEGTGLGLSIAFDIAREHRGTLELEPGTRGTCFALRLPEASEAPKPQYYKD